MLHRETPPVGLLEMQRDPGAESWINSDLRQPERDRKSAAA